MRLLPREEKFFHFFLGQVELISEASSVLLAALRERQFPPRRGGGRRSAAWNSEGDEIIHDIFTALNQTFITPLDPEDIHSLART